MACQPRVCMRMRNTKYCIVEVQGGGTPLQSVLRAATAVKIKVNSQLEIFSIVNSQATLSL